MEGFEHYSERKFLNVSTLTATARCPRKAFYSSGCGFDTPTDKPALKFGEAIHRAIPELMVGGVETQLTRGLTAFDKVWNPLISDDKRNRENALSIMVDFQQSHKGQNGLYTLVHPRELPNIGGSRLEISGDDSVSEYEIVFVIDIGLRVPLVGRVDAIGRLRDTGELVAIEYKTTSSLYEYFQAYELSPQVLLYNAGLQVSGLKISRCIVEALLVSKTKTETVAQPFHIFPHHVEECLNWARYVGGLFLDCEDRKDFPKFFSGCHPYSMFGSRGYTCDYLQLCKPKDWTSQVPLFIKKKDTRYDMLGKVVE